jgi:hypothetical protein
MPVTQLVLDHLRTAGIIRRTARGLRRAVVLAGVVGLTAMAGLLTAASALAAHGSQPGSLILHPAIGATTLQPTWSTTDGCPAGYQGSAEVSAFQPNGAFGSRISFVVSTGLTHRFSGTLDYKMALLLKLGARVGNSQGSEWAVGCYSGPGGTGKVKYVQSTFVTLSSTGSSYSTSSANGQRSSTSPDPTSTPTGNGVGVPIDVQVQAASPTTTPTSTPTASATPSVSATPGPTPTATSTTLPAGGPATGAGGATHSGSTMLIALGATALAGSAAAAGLAIRRRRRLAGDGGLGPSNPGAR